MNNVWQEGGPKMGWEKTFNNPQTCGLEDFPSFFFSFFSLSMSMKGVQSLLDEGRSAVNLGKGVKTGFTLSIFIFVFILLIWQLPSC